MTDNKQNPDNSIHDRFFCSAMSDLRVAKDFLQRFLPPLVQQKVNLDALQLVDAKFIASDFRGLLFQGSTKNGSKPVFILVERQHVYDDDTPLRIAEYMLAIIKKYKAPNEEYPIVLPMVFYHGQQACPRPKDLRVSTSAIDMLMKPV